MNARLIADGCPHDKPYRWVILAVATLTQALACFLVQGLGVLAPFLQADLALSAAQVGALMSVAQVVPLVGLVLAGELLDRFGERLLVSSAVGLLALALLGASQASHFSVLSFWLLLVGAAYSAVQPGGSQAVSRWFAQSQRGLAMGIRQAGLPLGGAVAALVLPVVAVAWGWRAGVLCGALAAGTAALLFLIAYRTPAQGAAYRPQAAEREASSWRRAVSERRRWLQDPRARAVLWSGMSLVATQVGILAFVVTDFRERLLIPIERGAGFLALMLTAGVVGRIVLASLSDRSRSGRYVCIWSCLLAALAGQLALIFIAEDSTFVLAALSLWVGFFAFGWYGPWVTFAAESAPPGRTGSFLGTVMATNQCAIVATPLLLGWGRDVAGSFVTGWLVLAGVLLLACAVTHRSLRFGSLQPAFIGE